MEYAIQDDVKIFILRDLFITVRDLFITVEVNKPYLQE